MAQLACRDLGMDCDTVITGDSVDEVMHKAFQHAGEAHAEILATMATPEQTAEMQQLVLSKVTG
jgi:predicted small metal-binding protein